MMRQSTRRTLRWAATALLLVAGLTLFFVVAARSYLALTTGALGQLSAVDLLALVAGVGLCAAARWVGPWTEVRWRLDAGDRVRYRRPEPSRLEELGYRVPREASDETDRTTVYEDGTVYRRCPECGEANAVEFSYCRNCSSKLER